MLQRFQGGPCVGPDSVKCFRRQPAKDLVLVSQRLDQGRDERRRVGANLSSKGGGAHACSRVALAEQLLERAQDGLGTRALGLHNARQDGGRPIAHRLILIAKKPKKIRHAGRRGVLASLGQSLYDEPALRWVRASEGRGVVLHGVPRAKQRA
jgi:hypothetical protein